MKTLIIASGGDAPGMNKVIHTLQKKIKGEIFAVEKGFKGLYENNIQPLSNFAVKKFQNQAGCVIKSSRFPEFKEEKFFKKALKNLSSFQNVVVLGGNGSFKACQEMEQAGFKTFFAPCTIDNDVNSYDYSVGFLTAVKSVCHTISNIMPSMDAFNRCCIFEVMGRHCPEIAKLSGKILQPDILIESESDIDLKKIVKVIKEKHKNNSSSFIIIKENLIDIKSLASDINNTLKTNIVKTHIVGHIQRGFTPTKQELNIAKKIALSIAKQINKQ